MKALWGFFLILTMSLPLMANDWFSIYNNRQISWLERWEPLVAQAEDMPPDTRIEILSHLLGNANNPNYTEKQKSIARRASTILLNTPGHARYYGDKLKENPRSGDRRYWFKYLQNLPSPETVAVLGELLADDSERPILAEDGSNAEWYLTMRRQTTPNCDRAISALLHLLDNPPVPASSITYNHDEGTLESWRNWYENVKEGRQTFRFKGDPVHYDLRGPSKRGEVLPNTSRHGKRSIGNTEQNGDELFEESRSSARLMGYVLAGFFLIAGAWFYIRRRKAA